MDFGEFKKIAKAIQAYYPKAEYFKDQESVMLWYEELRDMDYQMASLALRKHVRTSKFPPTIADIIGQAVDVQTTNNEWSDGWESVLRAVRSYGYNREKEALESMDDITRQVVRRLNWQMICQSPTEELMSIRANFRTIYNEIKDRHTDTAKLSESMRAAIGEIKGAKKLLGN